MSARSFMSLYFSAGHWEPLDDYAAASDTVIGDSICCWQINRSIKTMSCPCKRLRAATTMTHRPHTTCSCFALWEEREEQREEEDEKANLWLELDAFHCAVLQKTIEDIWRNLHFSDWTAHNLKYYIVLVKLTVHILVFFHLLPNLPQMNVHLSVPLSKRAGYISATSQPLTALEPPPPWPIKGRAHRVKSL